MEPNDQELMGMPLYDAAKHMQPPRPWHKTPQGGGHWAIHGEDGSWVCNVVMEDDADLIVRAVNAFSHADAREAEHGE